MTKDEIEQGIARLSKQFMTPEIWQCDVWSVETEIGTEYVPADVGNTVASADDLRAYVEGSEITSYERLQGKWCARLSASGYMDATDLTVHSTEDDARAYLVETYDDQDAED